MKRLLLSSCQSSRRSLPLSSSWQHYPRMLSSNSSRNSRCLSTNVKVTQTKSDNHQTTRSLPQDGLTLGDFVQGTVGAAAAAAEQQQQPQTYEQDAIKFHLKTYGCQMNVNDSDIVRSLLLKANFQETQHENDATILLTNTCAIREGAETKVWHRLKDLHGRYNKHYNPNTKQPKKQNNKKKKQKKIVGVLGCMAERLKENLFKDGLADLVVGPDAYRDLPNLVHKLLLNHYHQDQDTDDIHMDDKNNMTTAVNVQLSLEETYADVTPIRHNPDDVSAFVSVMRGCNNMCSYCVVPFTRGRERSRPLQSIVEEARHLVESENVKEIVLLGQNVNSYHDKSEAAILAKPIISNNKNGCDEINGEERTNTYQTSNEGFKNLYKLRGGAGYYFADLVEAISDISPELRVRFTSPHPKDYPPELLSLMAERPNVCNQLHMPAQSGSSSVLARMRRGYTREAYLELIDDVRRTIPDVAISSDFISGFCDETQQEHHDTLSLMQQVQYDQAYMFAYSMRGKTHAHRKMTDNVPEEIKKQRLQEVIHTFRTNVQRRNEKMEIGRLRLVLVEGESKKSKPGNITFGGRTDQNKRILFPYDNANDMGGHEQQQQHLRLLTDDMVRPLLSQIQNGTSHQDILTDYLRQSQSSEQPSTVSLQPGDYAVVEVTEVRGHTLRGRALWKTSLTSFSEMGLFNVDESALQHSSNLRALLNNI